MYDDGFVNKSKHAARFGQHKISSERTLTTYLLICIKTLTCSPSFFSHFAALNKIFGLNLKVCHPRCVYQNYSRSMMGGIAVNNTTIFVIYDIVY